MLNALADRAHKLRPDRPQGGSLRVVPILGPNHEEPAYDVLRPETLNLVSITEVSDAGSVPRLRVNNGLDCRLYLMDGQELVGAKQNRILNTDVLVPGKSSLDIPVSCVEQGRWRSVSPTFSPGKAASHRTRSGKMERVYASLKARKTFDANQGAVWQEVEAALFDAGAEEESSTRALADAYAKRQGEMQTFRSSLALPATAVGVAVFHGRRFKGLDLFDRHATLQAFWASLVDSYAIDFLDAPVDLASPTTDATASPDDAEVRSLLQRAAAANWEPFDSPGEGKDWRLVDGDLSGAALLWEDRVVLHVQLYPRQGGPHRPDVSEGSMFRPGVVHRRRWPARR